MVGTTVARGGTSRSVRLALAAAAILAACGAGSGCTRRPEPQNLIVIVIDALRADRLGCYGRGLPTSPAIDRIASEGVLFEQAMAQCSFTPPAMASLLTGRYVPSHGLLGWESRLAAAETTLAEVLQSAGYRTATFVFLRLLSRHGLNQGFNRGEELVEPAERVTELAREWIEKAPEEKFFLFLHLYDVHRPYEPRAPYDTLFDPGYTGDIDGSNATLAAIQSGERATTPEDERHLEALYDGEVRQTDDVLAEFFTWLETRGLLDTSILVITADHGEMLAERPEPWLRYTHDPSLYDPVMRIPLIVRAPGKVARGVRIPEQVRQIDIMPSVLALLGVAPPRGVEGEPFFARGGALRVGDRGAPPRPAFADVYPEPKRPERYLRALRVPGRKVIHSIYKGAWEEYDLGADPGETRSIWESGAAGTDAGASPAVGPDSLAEALLAHAEECGEVHEVCVAWVERKGVAVSGSVALSGGRALGVDHPPAGEAPTVSVNDDGRSVTFRTPGTGGPGAIWVRVTPPNVRVDVTAQALPITVLEHGTTMGHAGFSLPEIGHAMLNPFPTDRPGIYVFGRARLMTQRIPVDLGPEEIERLRSLGYIGEAK
jgi:arylsulfatase